MPIVSIDWLEGRDVEQRRTLAQEITRAIVDVAKCSPEAVTIIFNEHPREGMAKGGKLFSDK